MLGFHGIEFVLGRCSSDDRLDIISRPLFGAADGNRTHLSLADNESPSQRATTAYWYSERVSIPLLQLERLAS